MSLPEPIRFPIARDMALGLGFLSWRKEDGLGMVWLVQGLVRVEGEYRQRSDQDRMGMVGTVWAKKGRSGLVRDGPERLGTREGRAW